MTGNHPPNDKWGFLRSARTPETPLQGIDTFFEWFRRRDQAHRFEVRRIPFSSMGKWYFADNPYRLVHSSGKFFSVEGIRVRTNYGSVPEWDQPIVIQPETGILGIITKVCGGVRHFLMQAKKEPGNILQLQLSPTVQATRSNYTQVHKGKIPPYLDYFMDRSKASVIIDQLQSEQAARFLRKRNRNIIVEVTEDIPVHDDFCWVTLGRIKQLLKHDNLVNMDARTVLSCIPLCGDEHTQQSGWTDTQLTGFSRDLCISAEAGQSARYSFDELISWITELKCTYEMSIERIPLDELRHWVITDDEIRHETGLYFSVRAYSVEAEGREVASWTQPLLSHDGYGLVGFVTQKIGGILHFLVRAAVEPGNLDMLDVGPTVSCFGVEQRRSLSNLPVFSEYFLDALPETIRYSATQSEEGGRFHHFVNRYMVIELPASEKSDLPENFTWMTLRQLSDFLKFGYVNIEARNLLACLSL